MATESKTRPVSIRVPNELPDQIRAITGMSFSEAAVTLLQAFVRNSRHDTPQDTNHDNTPEHN